MPNLHLFCFQSTQTWLNDQPLAHFPCVKAQTLLIYLAIEHDHPHQRNSLAGRPTKTLRHDNGGRLFSFGESVQMRILNVIIILGSPNDDQGRLGSIALERCARALIEFQQNPTCSILPTGGWGQHFNTTDKAHATYIRRYLVSNGVPDTAFLPCAKSSNTIEDATLSKQILTRYPDAALIVVTSDFHAPRAQFLFEREFPDREILISPSKTNLSPDELSRCVAHEKQALTKLQG